MLTVLLSQRWPRARLLCAAGAYLLAIGIGNIPGARADMAQLASGLVLHSLSYAGLAWLFFTGLTGSAARRACTAVAMIAVLGAADEGIQSFFPYRRATVQDWLVDVSAATLVCALLWLLARRRG